jgi:hypothetical protein
MKALLTSLLVLLVSMNSAHATYFMHCIQKIYVIEFDGMFKNCLTNYVRQESYAKDKQLTCSLVASSFASASVKALLTEDRNLVLDYCKQKAV